MFQQLQIRIKRGNRVISPDEGCTTSDQLCCAGSLAIGFGEVYHWEAADLIPLAKLIGFYHDLARSTRISSPSSFQHSFGHRGNSVQLHWTVQPHARLNFTIYRQATSEQEIMTRPVEIPAVLQWMNATYATLLTQVTETVSPDISLKIGELFAGDNGAGFLFSPGQKVRTILSSYVRTLHIGFVLHRMRHETDLVNSYQLLVNGKSLKRWFREEDLEPMA